MIGEVLYTISTELPVASKEPFKGNYLADYIRNEAVDLIRKAVPPKFQHYDLKGSAGMTGWVKDKNAWIGIFSDITHPGKKKASQSYYPVYVFPINSKYVMFGLGQSFGEAKKRYGKGWEKNLEKHAELMRDKIPHYSEYFDSGKIEFSVEGGDIYYESGYVYHRSYDVENMPEESELIKDLETMLEAYNELIEKGGRDIDADLRNQEDINSEEVEESKDWESNEKLVLKEHKRYERKNSSAIKKLKEKLNYPPCVICGLNFEEEYGVQYIEAHHIVPFSEMKKKGLTSRKISEKDIAMLCANCHRMIHKYKNMSIDQLKKLYISRRKV
tara:strand:- start:289 stop:1275 length:987 start_codon:yes stop_codon:yes gene_type:complete